MALDLTPQELAKYRERFWSHVAIGAADECWLWQGAKSKGYGKTNRKIDGRMVNALAHRTALRLSGVEVKVKDLVLHSCDVKACCNPAHLRVGTGGDNVRDRAARQPETWNRGERNHAAKLNREQVEQIRRRAADGETYLSLAARFSVAITNIGAIVRRHTWQSVP